MTFNAGISEHLQHPYLLDVAGVITSENPSASIVQQVFGSSSSAAGPQAVISPFLLSATISPISFGATIS